MPLTLGWQQPQLDLGSCKARLEEIGAQLKLGKLSEAEADAARLALLAPPRASGWASRPKLRGSGALIAPAAVFLLVAGIGAASSYVGDRPEGAGAADMNPFLLSESGSDGEVLAGLSDYAGSIGTEAAASTAAPDKLLPDVNTMIERLAARLETTPEDLAGWRMLGWAYFNIQRYGEAATAYAKAIELDPSSTEIKGLYEEAKANASAGSNPETAFHPQTETATTSGDGSGGERMSNPEAIPADERDAAIRSMIDGLAARLESSPRDVDGWTRLMRSRVVLGEREVAATTFRKALEVFKDDFAASSQITAAAIELGLRAE